MFFHFYGAYAVRTAKHSDLLPQQHQQQQQQQHIFIELTRYLLNTQMYGMHFRIPNKSTLHVWPLVCCRAPRFSFTTSSCASFFHECDTIYSLYTPFTTGMMKIQHKNVFACVYTRYVHARANRNSPRNLDLIFIKCCGICQSIFQFESYAQPYIPSTVIFGTPLTG